MDSKLSLLTLLLLPLHFPTLVFAVKAPCSACTAVTRELRTRLDAERPEARNHLDMRHRLDKDGNRYGKLIPYVDSEQRIHDLLEDLCSKVDKAVELMQVNRTAQDGAEQLQWEWVQLAGGPKGMGQGTRKLPANEAKTSKRELGVFCESLLEKHEERIAQAIRAGAAEAGADIEDICLRIDNDVPRLQHWAQQLTSFMVRSCAGIRDVLCKRVCHGDNPIEDAQDSETDKDEL